MTVVEVITAVLMALGCFVVLTSALGFLRLPDFFSRIHAAGMTDTLGQVLLLSGLAVFALFGMEKVEVQAVIKLFLIAAFLFVSTPSSTHAIARAAHESGLEPWKAPPPAEPAVDPVPSEAAKDAEDAS